MTIAFFRRTMTVLCTVLFVCAVQAHAQNDKAAMPSPPATATTTFDNVTVTVKYHQPAKKGREIFGKLVPYGEVWRTGANNPTKISFSADVVIGGKALKAGDYALFTIPNKDKWIVIINSDFNQWGAYSYKQEKDLLRTEVTPTTTKESAERFTIGFEKADKGTMLTMAWDMTKVSVAITK